MSGSPATVRIAVLDDYQQVASSMADWASLPGAQPTFFADHVGEDELIRRVRDHQVIVAMRERTAFPARVLEQLPDLRLLVTTGMRNASIDIGAAERAGVVVAGTRGLSTGTVELIWGLILAASRRIASEDRLIRAGGWQGSIGLGLAGRTLGLAGLGRLGSQVAAIGVAFGMRVLAWSPHLTADRAAEHGAVPVSKQELFATSDVVSVHLVLAESTRGLIGAADLRAMKPSAILVNTSRGPIVDEAALLRALDEGWIAGAALDVYDQEPLPPDHPLRRAPRATLSPHLGYVTDDNYRLFYGDAVEDIRSWLAGQPVRVLPAPAPPS